VKICNVNNRDTGNQCYRLSKAINETFPEVHESHAFIMTRGYTQFPVDVQYRGEWARKKFPKWIREFWEGADVVHRHGRWHRGNGWPAPKKKDVGKILHQHGRWDPSTTLASIEAEDQQRRQIRVVSTISLLPWVRYNPERWFPTPIDLDRLDTIKEKYGEKPEEWKEKIVVSHSPTLRRLKNTEHFLRMMKRIKARNPKVELLLIERKTYANCLVTKACADICFDQLLLQHGTNGLEAMAFGQPVVAGSIRHKWVLPKIKEICGWIPFVNATERTLMGVLEELINEPELRKWWGLVGRAYVEKWHSHEFTAKRAIKTYEEAIEYARTVPVSE
jgi:glycosyltransferase involved in cell wall biosynthesis